jgi:hypothetical protein
MVGAEVGAMTAVEKLEQAAAYEAARSEWAARLVAALVDPTAWEWTGKVDDAGKGAHMRPDAPRCACGHPIRYVYRVRCLRDVGPWRAGDVTQVGSVCVGAIAHLAPGLAEGILRKAAELERAAEEARRAARRAAQEAEVERLRQEWEALVERARAEFARYPKGRAPYALWEAVASYRRARPTVPPDYVRPADYARWYRREIAAWKMALGLSACQVAQEGTA